MFENPSLITRITIGKILWLITGICSFFTLVYFLNIENSLFVWGIVIWYTTVGAIVGMFGVYTSHPILKLPMPWWVRGPIIGGWMNFLLTFFIYEQLEIIFISTFNSKSLFSNPFWFTFEGALVGMIIDYFSTRFGGEGQSICAK